MSPWRILLPLGIIAIGAGISATVVFMKPEAAKTAPTTPIPKIETIPATTQDVTLNVRTQGTVRPRTASALTPEVDGRIVNVAQTFRPGGFFKQGEVLISIDPADYKSFLAQRQAELATARLRLAEEQAQAEQAARDWEELGRGKSTDLTLRKPQIEKAKADIASAEAAVERARRDLDRTEIKAPYDGRILEKFVDVGQRVGMNTQLANIYSIDAAEVRLPLSLEEAGRLKLPLAYANESATEGPPVVLSAQYGGQSWQWQGRIVRTEAAIDERTRLTFVVARVDNPYARDPLNPERPPLKVGLFVTADIQGRTLRDVIKVPRYAMLTDRELLTVSDGKKQTKLQRRTITPSLVDDESAYFSKSEFLEGERIVTTPPDIIVDGMTVELTNPMDGANTASQPEPDAEVAGNETKPTGT